MARDGLSMVCDRLNSLRVFLSPPSKGFPFACFESEFRILECGRHPDGLPWRRLPGP